MYGLPEQKQYGPHHPANFEGYNPGEGIKYSTVQVIHSGGGKNASNSNSSIRRRLLKVFLPDHASQLISYIDILLSLHDEMPFFAVDRTVLRKELWKCVFTQLRRYQNEELSIPSVIGYILKCMAKQYSLNYADCLENLIFRLDLFQHSTTQTALLAELLTTLQRKSSQNKFPDLYCDLN